MKILYQNKYRTDSVRINHHDYLNGLYFVTICTHHYKNLFGDVKNGQMQLNEIGEIIKTEWKKTATLRPNVKLSEFVIMPNHFHGIILIKNIDDEKNISHRNSEEINYEDISHKEFEKDNGRDVTRYVSTEHINNQMAKISPQCNSLSTIIRLFKSSCTREIRKIGFNDFKWQPRFYEHIIRNDKEYNNIQNYIIENPQKWENDKYYKN
jgi:putative transposase